MEIPQGWAQLVMPALGTLAVLLLALLYRAKVSSRSSRSRLPPGPRGWPVVGSLLSLGTRPHQALYELSKKYGPVMFVNLGSAKTLVVTSPQLAEEILKSKDHIMASRPDLQVSKVIMYNSSDVAFSPYGEHWRQMRKICTVGLLTATRLSQFQDLREEEVLACLHSILEESELGKPVNMIECFSTLTTNNITQMMMSKRYCVWRGRSTAAVTVESTSVNEMLKEMSLLVGAFNIADFVPMLKPLDLQGLNKRIMDLHLRLDKFLEEVIAEHRQKRLSNETPDDSREDFIDSLLAIGETEGFEKSVSMDNIKALVLDMASAGADTSSATAQWALARLLKHPNVMRRVQEELDEVVGRERLLTEADVPKLKYFQAVIKETFRLHPVAPLLVPHESMNECEIAGYRIPLKTRIIVNVWGIHRDSVVWEGPLEFDPDRFLNSTVDVRGQDFQLLPFGSGRRMCPGINMALLMVQYSLAQMLHAISWALPEGQKPEEMDMSETFGVVLYKTVPVKVVAKPRLPNHVIYPPPKAKT